MPKSKTYDEFVEKFKPKKTTDDCYTPEIVYNAIADWVANEYSLDKSLFVRPFYPNGDYEHFDYSGGKIVVDNPPFSIIKQICQFYVDNQIKFFLFAPTLTSITRISDFCTALCCGVSITYENGAKVSTSFCTNLEPHEIRMKSCPTLYEIIDKANKENQNGKHKNLPKYQYPMNLVTSAMMYQYSEHGIDFAIPRSESTCISALDEQRKEKKEIFGCGLLYSDYVKAERIKAEQLQAHQYQLSERESQIIQKLNQIHEAKT